MTQCLEWDYVAVPVLSFFINIFTKYTVARLSRLLCKLSLTWVDWKIYFIEKRSFLTFLNFNFYVVTNLKKDRRNKMKKILIINKTFHSTVRHLS